MRQDHANERAEMAAKLTMEVGEEGVDKGFSGKVFRGRRCDFIDFYGL